MYKLHIMFNLYKKPLELYEYLLLGPLISVYNAKMKNSEPGFLNYSNLIIDKFAIHSSSFYHLSNGIIEHNKSSESVIMRGYDLFSVNSLFRTILENYATFNHLFVEPKSVEEKEFRFLLWKIDGLFDKEKFSILDTDFTEAKENLEKDKEDLNKIVLDFETSGFFKKMTDGQLKKIYNPAKKRFSWRFLVTESGDITPLKITDLIKHTCKIRAFINTYRYTSIHTHTNYLAIEHFKQTRGKIISKEYTDPITRLAIYLTCMMIHDISLIDRNGKEALDNHPKEKGFYYRNE